MPLVVGSADANDGEGDKFASMASPRDKGYAKVGHARNLSNGHVRVTPYLPHRWCSTKPIPALLEGANIMNPFACAGLLAFALTSPLAAQTTNWPQFRGPHADGLGEGA